MKVVGNESRVSALLSIMLEKETEAQTSRNRGNTGRRRL